MTISTGNAIAQMPSGVEQTLNIEAQGSLNQLSSGTVSSQDSTAGIDFASLLTAQMDDPDAVKLTQPEAAQIALDDEILQPFELALNSVQANSDKASSDKGLDDSDIVPELTIDVTAGEDESDIIPLFSAATAELVSDTTELDMEAAWQVTQGIKGDKETLDVDTDEAPLVASVGLDALPVSPAIPSANPSAIPSDIKPLDATDGQGLPPIRQNISRTSSITLATQSAQNAQLASINGQQAGSARLTPAEDLPSAQALMDEAANETLDEDFKAALLTDKDKLVDQPRQQSQGLAVTQARQDVMAQQMAGDSAGFQLHSDLFTHVVSGGQTLHSGVSGAALNPAFNNLQLPAQASSAQWGDALGEKVSLMIDKKLDKAEIRIDPPHLGKLDIQINLKHDTATINIQAHHASTRDVIDAASGRLREFLQDSGYGQVDVNVSQREQSMAQDNPQQGQDAPASLGAISDTGEEGMNAVPSMSQQTFYMSAGGIDYFA